MRRRDFLKRAGMLAVAMPVLGSLPAPAEAAANWTPPEIPPLEPGYWFVENPTNKPLTYSYWPKDIVLEPGCWAIIPSELNCSGRYDAGLQVTWLRPGMIFIGPDGQIVKKSPC